MAPPNTVLFLKSPGCPESPLSADNEEEGDNFMQWVIHWEPACSGYFAVSPWVSSSSEVSSPLQCGKKHVIGNAQIVPDQVASVPDKKHI